MKSLLSDIANLSRETAIEIFKFWQSFTDDEWFYFGAIIPLAIITLFLLITFEKTSNTTINSLVRSVGKCFFIATLAVIVLALGSLIYLYYLYPKALYNLVNELAEELVQFNTGLGVAAVTCLSLVVLFIDF